MPSNSTWKWWLNCRLVLGLSFYTWAVLFIVSSSIHRTFRGVKRLVLGQWWDRSIHSPLTHTRKRQNKTIREATSTNLERLFQFKSNNALKTSIKFSSVTVKVNKSEEVDSKDLDNVNNIIFFTAIKRFLSVCVCVCILSPHLKSHYDIETFLKLHCFFQQHQESADKTRCLQDKAVGTLIYYL